jgi:hypothetical protein
MLAGGADMGVAWTEVDMIGTVVMKVWIVVRSDGKIDL